MQCTVCLHTESCIYCENPYDILCTRLLPLYLGYFEMQRAGIFQMRGHVMLMGPSTVREGVSVTKIILSHHFTLTVAF